MTHNWDIIKKMKGWYTKQSSERIKLVVAGTGVGIKYQLGVYFLTPVK
jgi:hypothetical protein